MLVLLRRERKYASALADAGNLLDQYGPQLLSKPLPKPSLPRRFPKSIKLLLH